MKSQPSQPEMSTTTVLYQNHLKLQPLCTSRAASFDTKGQKPKTWKVISGLQPLSSVGTYVGADRPGLICLSCNVRFVLLVTCQCQPCVSGLSYNPSAYSYRISWTLHLRSTRVSQACCLRLCPIMMITKEAAKCLLPTVSTIF